MRPTHSSGTACLSRRGVSSLGDFSGQGAVVTGASSGIGRAIAVALAQQGARVCLVGRHDERLQSAAAEAGSGIACRADLTRDEDIARLAARARAELPGVDLLVHAAAIIAVSPLEHASMDDLDSQYRTNVRAPYALSQALLQALRARQGQIAFVNSSAGRNAGAGSSQYAATKHALTAVANSLRAEVNSDGVRVLSIFLGRTATPMQASLTRAEGREYRPEHLIQPSDVAQMALHALSLPRTAEVTEIAMRPMRKG
jgi:NADP-dependent 3-hydroxy acid dehydrogenase YdfG